MASARQSGPGSTQATEGTRERVRVDEWSATTRFCVDLLQRDGQVLVHLAGELDLATATRAELAVRLALARSCGRLVLDLSELRFCDSSGLRALLHMQDDATAEGRDFVVHRPSPAVRRVLELTGLDQRIIVTADAADPPAT
jgi:anti-sigma B factor antagonist